jgi:hypothetical protein
MTKKTGLFSNSLQNIYTNNKKILTPFKGNSLSSGPSNSTIAENVQTIYNNNTDYFDNFFTSWNNYCGTGSQSNYNSTYNTYSSLSSCSTLSGNDISSSMNLNSTESGLFSNSYGQTVQEINSGTMITSGGIGIFGDLAVFAGVVGGVGVMWQPGIGSGGFDFGGGELVLGMAGIVGVCVVLTSMQPQDFSGSFVGVTAFLGGGVAGMLLIALDNLTAENIQFIAIGIGAGVAGGGGIVGGGFNNF